MYNNVWHSAEMCRICPVGQNRSAAGMNVYGVVAGSTQAFPQRLNDVPAALSGEKRKPGANQFSSALSIIDAGTPADNAFARALSSMPTFSGL